MLPKDKKLDPRVVRTRRDLIQALCLLLKEKSFNETTVRDITDRALINRATFYAHFEDKYAILEDLLYTSFEERLSKYEVEEGRVTAENLHRLTLIVCEFLVEFHDEHTPSNKKQHLPIEWQLQEYLYKFLLEWIVKTGVGGTESQAESTAMMVSSLILGTAFQWARGKRTRPAETMANQIVDLLLNGLDDLRSASTASKPSDEAK
ncbi:MAG: TetR/AcrR family transcriptional regulator [Chloroflexota bacterium]